LNKKALNIAIFILLSAPFLYGQEVYNLRINFKDSTEKNLINTTYKKTFSDDLSREKEIKKLLSSFYDKGFLSASVENIQRDSLNLIVLCDIGKQLNWVTLSKGNVEPAVLKSSGYYERFYNNKPFNTKKIVRFFDKILSDCENNGYPFASVKLDSISYVMNKVNAAIFLDKKNKINIDSLNIKGSARLSKTYLYRYFGLKQGQLYDESKVANVNQRMKELQFLRVTKPVQVVFYPKFARIIVYADKKKANSFDGVLGVLPNSQTTGKLMLTGEARLKLVNSFGRAELIDMNWRKLEQSSQDLKVNFNYPYIFSSSLGADFRFSLLKQDTTYLNIVRNAGIQYLFTGNNYLKAYILNNTSQLLNTTGMEYITELPVYADISNTMYGLETKYEKLDYRLNPRKGFTLLINTAAGNKNIKRNSKINPAVYDSIVLKSAQYRLSADENIFIPVFSKSTINLGLQSAAIINNSLFENELFRIGGLRTLRGFDEESIYASLYSILTVEYRYLFEQNSYINLFFNSAYYEKETIHEKIIDRPFGFGAGITFETRAGIFSINYALGKQFDNPIYFKQAKIHFGIVSYF